MIPLRDNVPSRTFPFVNYALIVANVAAFFYELSLGPGLESFIRELGVVPANYTLRAFRASEHFAPLFASMFLHGGFLHIGGNMLYLFIFGDNVEDRVGHLRYLAFYLLCGLVAAFTHIALNPGSTIPTIGASGAVAGVLGAYLLSYPHARVLMLVPIFIFLHFVEVPAVFFLVLWFLIQLVSGTGQTATAEGVAWWAHIGGFVAGAVLLVFFRKRPRRRRRSA